MFTVSLREFLSLDAESGFRPADLVLTVPDAWRETAAEALAEDLDVPWDLAPAGDDPHRLRPGTPSVNLRAGSTPDPDDLVAVHDAARPFASADLLARLAVAAATRRRRGSRRAGARHHRPAMDGTASYLERSTLLAVQTPQVFRWDLFQAAHAWAAGQRGRIHR